jgi:hypothetical protein
LGIGRWLTTDSIISSFERKIQGENYYVDYSYVLSSKVEFSKYKTMLKQLLHPVGLINYSFYNKQTTVELTDIAIQDIIANTISGTVSIGKNRITVSGIGTKFNIANTRGILSIGSAIAVNGESRTINAIVSNTSLITTSNVTQLTIANAGSGYSNGYLVFSGGGGQITGLTITAAGSGYENGFVSFSGTDEAIPAVASVEVYASNGAVRTLTLVSGGLYANTPIALPDTNPHRVVYANGITINARGEGYSNDWLVFSDGTPLRNANAYAEVFPSNGAIRTITVFDSGLYQSNPTVRPNTNANVVITSVTVTSTGNGHSNGVLTFSGGNPSRAALVRVETFPSNSAQVASITANGLAYGVNSYIQFSTDDPFAIIPANARIYVNDVGLIQNVVMMANGLYSGTPVVTANSGNASFTVTMRSLDGQIRKIDIVDPGLYSSAPTAVLNTTPRSVSSITSNTVANTFVGRSLSNGSFVFSGGIAVRDAIVTYNVFPSNGVINMSSIIIVDSGLYRVAPSNVSPNVTPVSVSEVLPIQSGLGYPNGYIVFSTTQGTANITANAIVTVNAGGAISNTSIQDVGLYANGADIIVIGVLDGATGTLCTSPTIAASFRIGHFANTENIANLVVTTSANSGQTAVVAITANSNTYTTAVLSVFGVANSQTNAVITVGFTGRNTAANAIIEVYNNSSGLEPAGTVNGAIRRVTINTNSVLRGAGIYYYTPTAVPDSSGSGAAIFTVNPTSWDQTANAQTAIIYKQ